MGLVAIVFGLAWRDAGCPSGLPRRRLRHRRSGRRAERAAHRAFSLPPLLVTLGTLSLFRGLAEGITGGADFVSGFPFELPIGRSAPSGAPPQAFTLAAVASSSRTCCTAHLRRAGMRSAGHPKARGMRVSRSVAGWPALRARRGRSGARRSYVARTGQAKADGHRVRADGDCGRRARRHGDHRRPRDDRRHAAGRGGSSSCRTGCASRISGGAAGILTGALLLATIAASAAAPAHGGISARSTSLTHVTLTPERSPSRCGTRSWPRCARWSSRQASSSPAATGGWCDRLK